MKYNTKNDRKQFWVAVRVQRGYVTDARIFESANVAKQTERRWRNSFNPDYDEIAVLKSNLVVRRKNKK